MINPSHLTPAQSTLLSGGRGDFNLTSEVVRFILCNAWAAATTRQYAAAVNQFLKFVSTLNIDDNLLPTMFPQMYHFILWCLTLTNLSVSSSTIKRYLTGGWMWHTLQNFSFPPMDGHRVCLLLKECTGTEVRPSRRCRVGLFLQDVLDLSEALMTGKKANLVTRAIIFVGFWGLAQMGELTLHHDHPLVFFRRKDVSFSEDSMSARIRLQMAKTAAHRELQFLRLRAQPNRLDPINVLHEVLKTIPGKPLDPLFPGDSPQIPMSRKHIVNFPNAHGAQDGSRWGGHSLCIGGASFQ